MIEINNLTESSINEEFLKKVAQKVLKEENKKEINLSIALIGSGRMRKLNKQYYRKNRVTDVLAFGQNQKPKSSTAPHSKNQKFPVVPQNELELGEVVICLSIVKKNAKRYKAPFEKELARVLIHGILHLLGYNHEGSQKKAKKMKKKEEYHLSKIHNT